MLKLGYKASAEQFAPTKLLDFACEAEAVGLDSAFVSDHFQPSISTAMPPIRSSG